MEWGGMGWDGVAWDGMGWPLRIAEIGGCPVVPCLYIRMRAASASSM